MDCKDYRIVELIQAFIYTMNDKSLRTDIIKYHIGKYGHKDMQWLGTWIVESTGSLQKRTLRFMQKNDQLPCFDDSIDKYVCMNKGKLLEKTSLFTVCIVYEMNLVHFVSFIYDPQHKKLTSFDPGVELYHHGQKTILPLLRRAFFRNKLIQGTRIVPQENLGRCTQYTFCGKKWGVQYNGNHFSNLPADSFCQTWTIFFLITFLRTKNFEFVAEWCDKNPNQREFIIIKKFMLPFLTRFKP